PAAWPYVESDADRMTRAENLARHAERVAQTDIESIGQYDQPCGDFFAVRQGDALSVGARRNRRRLGADELGAWPDFRAQRVDEIVVQNAVLIARPLLDQAAEARNPNFLIEGRGTQHRVGEPGLLQDANLRAIKFLAAKIERIGGMRVDQ